MEIRPKTAILFALLLTSVPLSQRGAEAGAVSTCVATVLRPILRDAKASDEEKRYRLIWKWYGPGEYSLVRRILRKARELSGGNPPPDTAGYRLDLMGALDSLAQAPLRSASRKLVEMGWLENEKRWTLLSLMALTYPAYNLAFLPADLIADHERQAKNRRELESDFRYYQLEAERERVEERWDQMEKNGQKKQAEGERKAFWTTLGAKIKKIDLANRDYLQLRTRFENLTAQAATDDERKSLDAQRTRALLENDLFSDIPARVAELKNETPESRARKTEALLAQRERLYVDYSIAIKLVNGGSEAEATLRKSGFGDEIDLLKLYPGLARAYRDKKITKEQYQFSLMQEAFTIQNVFATWQILGVPAPLTLDDARKQILAKLPLMR